MRQIVFLFTLLICFSHVNAETLNKNEFEKLRTDIRDNYAQSPHIALESLSKQLSSDRFTSDQRLVLLNYKAWFQLEAKQFSNAMKTLVIYKNLAEKSNKRGLMYGYYNISAGVYIELGMHQLALEHLSEALKYAALLNDDITNQTLNNIGTVYLALNMLDEAESTFRRYLDYLKQSNKPLDNAIATLNLVDTLIAKKQYSEARKRLKEVIQLKQQNKFDYLLGKAYLLMAKIEHAELQYPQALTLLDKSMAIFTHQNLVHGQNEVRLESAKIHSKTGDNNLAENQLKSISNSGDDLSFIAKVYQFESYFYESRGLYKQAIKSYKQYSEVQTKLIQQQADVNLAKALAQADLNEKEVEIAELTREKQLKTAHADAFKNLALSIAISLFIICVGSFFTISNIYKRKQRLAQALVQLEITQKSLVEAEKMAALTALVSGIAHQLNTPIGTATTAISFISDNLQQLDYKFKNKSLNTKDFNQFIINTDQAKDLVISNINRLASMIEQFKALNVANAIQNPMKKFEIKNFTIQRVDSLKHNFSTHIDFQVTGDEITLTSHPLIISDVFKTLVINAYEHGFNDKQNPLITIDIKKRQNKALITFQDNGSGIDEQILKDIFTPFYSTNLGGNNLGLGLNVVFNAVKYNLLGNISAIPCEYGACFVLDLPIDGSTAEKAHIKANQHSL
ncbi:tetratricopeptide repeat protein [Pseudoalteromonas atlantica]|uniref:tetratricopeptide repeat protein n=1 Tax=Pseudoalteromonas atlantica TaxID=288 RepID=UPI003736279B